MFTQTDLVIEGSLLNSEDLNLLGNLCPVFFRQLFHRLSCIRDSCGRLEIIKFVIISLD